MARQRTAPPTTAPTSAKTTAIKEQLLPAQKRTCRQTAAQPSPHSSPLSEPSIPGAKGPETVEMDLSNMSRKSQWIILAIASGACAAFNGVFAKLTTTELTTTIAAGIARFLGFKGGSTAVEVIIRAMFFGLNLIFNGVMWALFTKALARGTSTTQVSIINTSSNFMITAILGFFIFTESLPPLWWVGAAMLVAGNVIIGRREEKEKGIDAGEGAGPSLLDGEERHVEEEQTLLGRDMELSCELELAAKRIDEDDILDLGTPVDEERGL